MVCGVTTIEVVPTVVALELVITALVVPEVKVLSVSGVTRPVVVVPEMSSVLVSDMGVPEVTVVVPYALGSLVVPEVKVLSVSGVTRPVVVVPEMSSVLVSDMGVPEVTVVVPYALGSLVVPEVKVVSVSGVTRPVVVVPEMSSVLVSDMGGPEVTVVVPYALSSPAVVSEILLVSVVVIGVVRMLVSKVVSVPVTRKCLSCFPSNDNITVIIQLTYFGFNAHHCYRHDVSQIHLFFEYIFTHNDYTSKETGCVSEMITELHLELLTTRRTNRRLTIFHKAIHSHLSLPFANLLQPIERHSRHLNSKDFNTIHASKNFYKFSYFPRTIKYWNSLPDAIANITEPQQFKQARTHLVPNKHD